MAKKDQKNETAVAVKDQFLLPALNNDLGAAMAEEMDGLTISFDRVKIPSGGGLAFEVPGEDPESPDTQKELVGVIVDHHPANAYWADKYSGQNNAPDCSSMDGKVGTRLDGTRCPCNSCPENEWGSDADGRGKSCKNMHRVYILREGDMFPLLLTLPPTSIKNFSDYVAKRVITKNLRTYGVVTKVTLKKVQNAGGIAYSQAMFAIEKALPTEQTKLVADYAQGMKVLTRQLTIAGDDYNTTTSGSEEELY